MAFVFKSEKKCEYIPDNKNYLGPGEYLPKNSPQNEKQQAEPFLSTINGTIVPKNIVPGPGTYYKDDIKIKSIKNVIKSKNLEKADKVRVLITKDYLLLKPSEKIGFDCKAKRFQQNENNNVYPGPGTYFPSIEKETKYDNIRKKHIFSNLFSNYNNNPLSEKTNVRKNSDNNYDEKNIKNNSNNNISPKHIKNIFNRTFGKKLIQYDNYACRPKNLRSFYKYKNINDDKEFGKTKAEFSHSHSSTNFSDKKIFSPTVSAINFSISKNNKNNSNNNKKNKNNINKQKDTILNYRVIRCKKINKRKINKNRSLEDIFKNKNPGPGYYFDYDKIHNISINSPKPIMQKFQCFGSQLDKFYNMNKKAGSKLGPGEYFPTIKNPKFPENYLISKNFVNYPNFAPFSTKSQRFLESYDEGENYPGPGEYKLSCFTNEYNIDPKNKTMTLKNKFGSNEKKFSVSDYFMRDKFAFPGPGYYNNQNYKTILNENNKDNINNNFKKNIFLTTSNDKNLKNDNKKKPSRNFFYIEELKYKESIPPVGYYNLDFFNCINYDNKRKIFDFKRDNVCFNRTVSKKTLKKSNSTGNIDYIGPGYYFINDKKNNKKEFNAPFGTNVDRGLLPNDDKEKDNYESPPDFYQYAVNDYFNWNKKSFNVYFS